ncbi:hypothetical protein ACHAXT_010234 [Thalassiosira profunda]
MPGGRKKPSRGSKKSKPSRRDGASDRKKPVPLEEVLGRAETAMEMSDVDTALQLFAYAAGVLRSRAESGGGSGGDAGAQEKDRGALSTVLGKMGELKASNGDVDGARSDFLEAIELLGPSAAEDDGEMEGNCSVEAAQSSEVRAGLHLYLGQLSTGPEALEAFRTGVSALERTMRILERIQSSGGEIEDAVMEGSEEETGAARTERFLSETRRQLCAAHCSIAELYLTDLCEEPDAEAACEAALKAALAVDEAASASGAVNGGAGPEVWATMANFRLSQSRVSEAMECILKAYDRMRVGCEAMAALVELGNVDGNEKQGGEGGARELVEVDAASSLPEYGFRIQTAKLLLECASLQPKDNPGATEAINRCAQSATQVLGSLLAENDEIIEVWYLLGCAFAAVLPPNTDAANYYWENALEMLERVKKGLEESMGDGNNDEEEDENELEAIECQMVEVKTKLGRYKDDGEEDMDDS